MDSKLSINIRNILILFGSTFSVMAGAIITPALPEMTVYFSHIDNIEFLTKLMLSVPPLFIAIFSPIAGILFEKFGRKRVLIFSALLYGIAGSSGYYLDDIYLILIGRAFFGIAIAGLTTGFIVIVGDLFESSKVAKFIGIQGAVMSFGGVVYLLLGGVLADISWNLPFAVYTVSIIIAIGLLFFLKEPRQQIKIGRLEKIQFDKETAIVNLTAIFVMICYLMVPTQLPFLIKTNFPHFSASIIGVMLAVWIFFSSMSSIFYSRLLRIMSFSRLYAIGFATWGIAFLLVLMSSSVEMLYIALIFAGAGNGLVVPNLKAHILDKSSAGSRGRQSGFLMMSLYIGQFLSPILIQPLLAYISINVVFAGVGVLLLSIAGLYYMRSK